MRMAAHVLLVAACLSSHGFTFAQQGRPIGRSPLEEIPPGQRFPEIRPPSSNPRSSQAAGLLVAGVRITGNRAISSHKVQSYLKTRVDRAFDPETIQADVRELIKSGLFRDVRTYTQDTPQGVVVTFEVFELPMIQYIRFLGNRQMTDRKLAKEVELEVGQALSPFRVNEARRKIEEYYRSNGHPKTQVSVFEGNRQGDAGVVFVISEDYLQKIWHVEFKGNTIASDGRLKTQIKSKPGFMKQFFGGKVDRRQIEEDVQRLTAYYRGLGYFNAKIGRELRFYPSGKWVDIVFVINEGPQYAIRNVSVIGNQKFDTNDLISRLLLKSGNNFNATKMQVDENSLRDIYGGQGYIFADIRADVRFLEEPGGLDLVYNIKEGEQYRVGKINIKIAGDYPHTKQDVVLNRISLRPGDIIDIREIRNSRRRLMASQLFVNEPHRGVSPEITVLPPDLQKQAGALARNAGGAQRTTTQFRGQSPDPGFRLIDLDVWLTPKRNW